jgi:hypothetical protein
MSPVMTIGVDGAARCAARGRYRRDDDHARIALCEFGGECRKARVVAFRPAYVEDIIASFVQAVFAQTFLEGVQENGARFRKAASKHPDSRGFILRAHADGPADDRAAE